MLMESMKFDSLRYERQLREAGVPEAQAEVHANTMADAFGFWATNIVTKDYLDVKLEAQAAQFAALLEQRFAEQDRKFETRFVSIEGRIDQLDRRFAEIDGRFAEIDRRFAEIDRRFADIDRRFLEQDLKFEKRFHRINLQFYTLLTVLLVNSFGGVDRLLKLMPL